MSLYIIGDIQGCYDALRALLRNVSYDPQQDQLWFTGDLVNRGPKSLETLRFIKSLTNCVVVLGNHDLHLLAVAYGGAKLSRCDTLGDILESADSDELLTWLRHRPLLHHDSGRNLTLIHAGLAPEWSLEKAKACAAEVEQVLRGDHYVEYFSTMYGDEPKQWSEALQGQARLRFITNCLTRLRCINQQGELALHEKAALNKEGSSLRPWFSIPGRQSEQHRIVFGHWSTLGLYQTKNILGLDTGCLWGGTLTAARFDEQGSFQGVTQVACEMAQQPDGLTA